MKKTFPRNHE